MIPRPGTALVSSGGLSTHDLSVFGRVIPQLLLREDARYRSRATQQATIRHRRSNDHHLSWRTLLVFVGRRLNQLASKPVLEMTYSNISLASTFEEVTRTLTIPTPLLSFSNFNTLETLLFFSSALVTVLTQL